MQITLTKVDAFTIIGEKGLDPITVFVQDHERGRGLLLGVIASVVLGILTHVIFTMEIFGVPVVLCVPLVLAAFIYIGFLQSIPPRPRAMATVTTMRRPDRIGGEEP